MEEPMSIWMLFPRNLLLPPAAAGLILGFITGAVIISILKSAEPIRDHVGRDS
jgi:hypothetical protein